MIKYILRRCSWRLFFTKTTIVIILRMAMARHSIYIFFFTVFSSKLTVGCCGKRKTGGLRENPSEQGREPTINYTHIWRFRSPVGERSHHCVFASRVFGFYENSVSRDFSILLWFFWVINWENCCFPREGYRAGVYVLTRDILDYGSSCGKVLPDSDWANQLDHGYQFHPDLVPGLSLTTAT